MGTICWGGYRMAVSSSNSKIGKIGNVSLTPVKSCRNCAGCKAQCYAMKAYRQYTGTRASWDSNFELARTDRAAYFAMVRSWIAKRKKPPRFFRWHVAGDILDQNYVTGMCDIARQFPETRFLAFTKRYDLNYSGRPGNLEVVFSAWPGMPIKRARGIQVAWVQDGTENRIPDNAVLCTGNCEACGMCWDLAKSKHDVYFHLH